jgi:hypothetical protein
MAVQSTCQRRCQDSGVWSVFGEFSATVRAFEQECRSGEQRLRFVTDHVGIIQVKDLSA